MDIDRSQLPLFFSDYLTYLDVIRGKAKRTVSEYCNDVALFLRWLHCTLNRQPVSECADVVLSEITTAELEKVTVSVL